MLLQILCESVCTSPVLMQHQRGSFADAHRLPSPITSGVSGFMSACTFIVFVLHLLTEILLGLYFDGGKTNSEKLRKKLVFGGRGGGAVCKVLV